MLDIPKEFQDILDARKDSMTKERARIRSFLVKAVKTAIKTAKESTNDNGVEALVENEYKKWVWFVDVTPSDKEWLEDNFKFMVISCEGYAKVKPIEELEKELTKKQELQDAEVIGTEN